MIKEFIKFILYGLIGLMGIGAASLYMQTLVTHPVFILPVLLGIAFVGIFGVGLWYLFEHMN